MSAVEFASQAQAVVDLRTIEINECVAAGNVVAAKRTIADAVRELRDIKRAATDEERAIRSDFADARLKASEQGQTIGMFVNSKTRASMARMRAANKRTLARKQQAALDPYRNVKSLIDQTIAQLNAFKAEIIREGGSERRTSRTEVDEIAETPVRAIPTKTAPPPPMPPMWATDPYGRHEHRYWDGSSWTEHVSNAGAVSTDAPE
ncbi:MAG: DUF2510 domain-containing protein [Actinomycetes bacterium]